MPWHFQQNFLRNILTFQKQPTGGCSVRKGALRNFVKLSEKHPCQSLFFNKVAGNFIKKRTPFLKNTFFTEHLRAIASDILKL